MPYDDHQYIENYLRIRFRDTAGALVSFSSLQTTDIIFDNWEIKGDIDISEPTVPEVSVTVNGKAIYGPVINPIVWSFTINIDTPKTIAKLQAIEGAIRNGYRCEAQILAGYFTYDGNGGLTPHIPGQAALNPCVIEYDRQIVARALGRGRGLRRYIETPVRILESFDPVISGTNIGGGGQGGGVLGGGGGVVIGGGGILTGGGISGPGGN